MWIQVFDYQSGVGLTNTKLCETIRQRQREVRMKNRIVVWAVAGFLVASGWAVYFVVASKDHLMGPIVSILVQLTCPIAIVGLHHYPVSVRLSLVANVATYVLVGLALETLRRQLNHSN